MSQIRPGRAPRALPWPAELDFADQLGVDSLEKLKIGTALSEAIHLHRSGIPEALLTQATVGEWVETAARALDQFSGAVTFRTSGSTGQPKWCVHERVELDAEVVQLAGLLAGSRRVISAVPSHHIYGFLFTILTPLLLEAEVIDVRAQLPAQLESLLRPADVIIGYPEFWRAFARTISSIPPDVIGVTSTAPCPADVANGVRANGIARFVEIYGSSETAGIGRRHDPGHAYELFTYWRRGAQSDELIRTCVDGTERRFPVPDTLDWVDSRHVRPIGRVDGAVQVGGVNVFPSRIGALLCAQPGVAQAVVRLMRPDEGERLKAFVVPLGIGVNQAALEADLWSWADAHLTAPERPKSITFGSQLPTSANGKPADWPIA